MTLSVLASITLGTALAWFAYEVINVVDMSQTSRNGSLKMEAERQRRLSDQSRIYRWFKPFVDDFKDQPVLHVLGRIDRVRADVNRGAERCPFTAEEFLAVTAVHSVIKGMFVFLLVSFLTTYALGGLLGFFAAIGAFVWAIIHLHRNATERLALFKQRLPFVVDLLALMIEAGADFTDSLATIVRETGDHPISEEFGQVLKELRFGHSISQALSSLDERLGDPEVSELVFAINKGKEMGAKRSETLMAQAKQMRMKQSMRAEKMAGKANANMSFPGLVVMLACLLLVMAPFVLNAFSESSTF